MIFRIGTSVAELVRETRALIGANIAALLHIEITLLDEIEIQVIQFIR